MLKTDDHAFVNICAIDKFIQANLINKMFFQILYNDLVRQNIILGKLIVRTTEVYNILSLEI